MIIFFIKFGYETKPASRFRKAGLNVASYTNSLRGARFAEISKRKNQLSGGKLVMPIAVLAILTTFVRKIGHKSCISVSYQKMDFSASPFRIFQKRGRRGNSFPPVPLSFPRRPSGLGFCETPAAFRSKWVRADLSIAHQTGNVKFFCDDKEVCSPRLRARLARNEAVKSNGGTKSQDAIFSEMRRFVIMKLCSSFLKYHGSKNLKLIFSPSIPPSAELRRFSFHRRTLTINPRQNI